MPINARDSQFFSKVTPINNNVKETEVPNKEEPLTKQENNPTFIPETQNDAYGLYGHESGQLPPSTTTTRTNYASYTTPTTNLPYKTPSEEDEDFDKYPNNNYYKYNKEAYNANNNGMTDTRLSDQTGYSSNNNNYYYNKNAYEANKNGMGSTRFTERGYNTMSNQNNNNNNYYYNKNTASNYNVERQGMSDTRYMEGGKYYYDIDSENYNPNQYGSSREVVSTNWYKNNNNNNNRGYYGNNENSFEGYHQNQEEFQEDQEEFEP
ncbi:protein E6-like [Quillaja saponaria]|uniref:Protein E6-like n=1 Tax=Quillaja saponaria TaxID=32244 RepID=A0AAD7M258_QUISA|nr:protein E6-like [Quillaja saponaria]